MSLHDVALSKHPLRTDKEFRHDYYRKAYNHLLGGLKDVEFTLLEVGVYYGYSLGIWREYFSKATIIGVEINPYNSFVYRPQQADTSYSPLMQAQAWHGNTTIDPVAFYNNYKNCTIIYGDATKKETFKSITDLDVIIDDGSHQIEDIQKTFNLLYPKLNTGGMYIVEDSPAAIEYFVEQAGNLNMDVIHIYDGRTEKLRHTCIIALRKNDGI